MTPEAAESVVEPLPARAAAPSWDTAVLAAVALAFQVVLWGAAWSTLGASGPIVALSHAGIVTMVAAWARASGARSRYEGLLLLGTAAFGPFGPAGVLLAMAAERVHAPRASSIEAWHESLFPPTGIDNQADLWRRIGQRASDRPADQPVTPFLDVLAFGAVPQKQAVIAIIAQQFRPAFAPALRAALRDEHNVVRVQAATAIARLEQELLERTLALEAALERAPDEAEAVLALAAHYDDQAFGGLMDATREETSRDRAARGYERYLALRPEDAEVEQRLARLQLRLGQYAAAEPRLRRLFERGHPGAQLWLLECLFAQRKFADMRIVAVSDWSGTPAAIGPEAVVTLDLWAQAGFAVDPAS
jgi:hypothetical protein